MIPVRRATDYIAIHCAATKPSQDIGFAQIDRWHRALGWAMCGYHLIIRRSGLIERGRDLDAVGAHVKHYNSVSVGICLVGGLDEDGNTAPSFTDFQWDSLSYTVDFLRRVYPSAKIQGHRDFPGVNKACPSFDVGDWYGSV